MSASAPGSASWFAAVAELVEASGPLGNLRGEGPSVIDALREAAPAPGAEQAKLHALACAAHATLWAGLYREADALLADLAPAPIADPDVEGLVLYARAFRALVAGDLERYLGLQASLDRYEQAGDRRNACRQRMCIGYAHLMLGEHEEAEKWLRSSLALADRLGLGMIAAMSRHNLGPALAMMGRLDEARALETEAAAAFRAQGNKRLEGASYIYLSQIAEIAGDLAGAARHARSAIEVSLSAPPTTAYAQAQLAAVLLAAGDPAAALAEAKGAMTIFHELGGEIEEGEAQILLVHAEALHATGAAAAARAAIAAARARLDARTNRIVDPRRRASFRARVPENARTAACARRLLGEVVPACWK
jgi:tetratricopeptide (TPR) repeat protein